MSRPRVLRLPEVLEQTKLSKASVYRLVATNEFPCPIKLGERAVGWRASEIDAWLDTRERASIGPQQAGSVI